MPQKKDRSFSNSVTLDGEFELLSDYTLNYIPAHTDPYQGLFNQDHKINIKGFWEIDSNHDLRFKIQESLRERFGRELVFKGEFLKAEAGELDFTYKIRNRDGKLSLRTFRFFGKWDADENNRLKFTLNKSKGSTESLTLNGAWRTGKRHELIYTYRKQVLKTKTKKTKRIVLRGYWNIAGKRKAEYVLEGDSGERIRFRLAYSTPIILANKNEIRFQIGIEVTGRRRSATREIVLFGKWKLKRDLSLSFEVEYRNGEWHSLNFTAKYRLNAQTQIEAALTARNGDDLDVSITLTREFAASEGEAYLSLTRSLTGGAVEGGVRIPF